MSERLSGCLSYRPATQSDAVVMLRVAVGFDPDGEVLVPISRANEQPVCDEKVKWVS